MMYGHINNRGIAILMKGYMVLKNKLGTNPGMHTQQKSNSLPGRVNYDFAQPKLSAQSRKLLHHGLWWAGVYMTCDNIDPLKKIHK